MRAVHRTLATHGFAGLTTERVAEAADRSQSLIHYHYDTKEDLLVAFLKWVRAGEREFLTELEEGTPTERVRRFVEVQLSIPRDDEHGRFNVAFLELGAAAARNERYAAELREFSALVQDAVAGAIREGVETGEFLDVDPDATARFLRHTLHGAVAEHLTLGTEGARADARRAAETYLERVLLAGRA